MRRSLHLGLFFLLACLFSARAGIAAAVDPASAAGSAPLLQPTSVAYDTAGNLYFAETRNHVIRRVDRAGQLTTIAGSSVQGFSGDGGLALSARLDSPRGVTLDTAGNLFIADTRNHRIRRIDATTHQITTIAGTGFPGFGGDGGPAIAARLFSPVAVALDGTGHLFIADSGNQRIRSVDLATGLIQTIAGNGTQGYLGDGGPAIAAALNSPTGIAADPFGNLFIADSGNHCVREVNASSHTILTLLSNGAGGVQLLRPEGLSLDQKGDLLIADPDGHRVYLLNLATGHVTLIAGHGTQAYAGDQGLATLALLDSPSAIAASTLGDLAVADTGNHRIRILSLAGAGTTATISTLAGIDALLPATLALSAAPSQVYGSATILASLSSSSPAQGAVSLLEGSSASLQPIALSQLSANSSTFSLPLLTAGLHTLSASFPGDATHAAAQSAPLSISVSPAPVTANVSNPTLPYGQPIPAPTGTLSGVLPQDAASVALSVTGTIPDMAPPGTYPLQSALTGPAAANYILAAGTPTVLTITKAPAAVALSSTSGSLNIAVLSTTRGTPTGAVSLLTGASSALSSVPLTSAGTASLLGSGLAAGTYTLTAVYSGDANFLGARSQPITVTLGPTAPPAAPADFSLVPTSVSTVTVRAGETATFSFAFNNTGSSLAGPVLLSASGGPSLSTATLNPAVISPGNSSVQIALTVQLPRAASKAAPSFSREAPTVILCLLSPFLAFALRRRRHTIPRLCGLLLCCLVTNLALTGCGARTAGSGSTTAASPQSYDVTLAGVTTTASGSPLQHTAIVHLIVQ